MRMFRGVLVAAMRLRWITIVVTLGLLRRWRSWPAADVPRQFFPASDRPELLVDLRLPQNASIYASEAMAARARRASWPSDPDVERWSTYVGRGAIRFYLPLNVQLPNDFFSQVVIVAKDVAARERLRRAARDACWPSDFPEPVIARVYPLELGPPVGWPVQYRVSGPDIDAGARRSRCSWPQIVAANDSLRQVNFDWIEPARARCACASTRTRRGCSASARRRWPAILNTVVSGAPVTQVRDDIYLVDVVVRAHGRAAHLARRRCAPCRCRCRTAARCRSSQFATLELRAGVAADLAPRPRADADRAGRRGAGRAARDRGRGRAAGDRQAQQATCRAATRSRSAARSRRAPSRRPRSSAVVPVMLFLMLTVLMVQLQSFNRLVLVLSRRAAGPDRRGRRAAGLGTAARLRRDPRHPRADRHDRAQRGAS